MAKGDITIVTLFGDSVGQQVTDFTTKLPVAGSYRHTFGDKTWKCGSLKLNGAVRLVEDEYEGRVFFRLEGNVASAAQVEACKALRESLKDITF